MRSSAATLFDWTPPERVTAIETVASHAEENRPGWKQEAAKFVRCYAATHREFISEECTDWAYANGLARPHDPRAFGQVYREAAKAGIIRKGGYGRSVKRASPTVLWFSRHPNFSGE